MVKKKEFEEYKLENGEVIREVEVRDATADNKLIRSYEETIIKLPEDQDGNPKPVDVKKMREDLDVAMNEIAKMKSGGKN